MSSRTFHRQGAAIERVRGALRDCLADGRARTPLELARAVGAARGDVEAQIAWLLAARVLRIAAHGRHTYYALGAGGGEPRMAQASVFRPSTPASLRAARTCYGHLAGVLGVALHDGMLARGWLAAAPDAVDPYAVTSIGVHAFDDLGIDAVALQRRSRRCAHPCLDWSERRPHLGGALGAAVCDAAAKRHWIVRRAGSRQVVLTRAGQLGFDAWLGAALDGAALG